MANAEIPFKGVRFRDSHQPDPAHSKKGGLSPEGWANVKDDLALTERVGEEGAQVSEVSDAPLSRERAIGIFEEMSASPRRLDQVKSKLASGPISSMFRGAEAALETAIELELTTEERTKLSNFVITYITQFLGKLKSAKDEELFSSISAMGKLADFFGVIGNERLTNTVEAQINVDLDSNLQRAALLAANLLRREEGEKLKEKVLTKLNSFRFNAWEINREGYFAIIYGFNIHVSEMNKDPMDQVIRHLRSMSAGAIKASIDNTVGKPEDFKEEILATLTDNVLNGTHERAAEIAVEFGISEKEYREALASVKL